MEQTIKDAKSRMDKSLEALRGELAKIRSGKATTALLDGIRVDYYGNSTPLIKLQMLPFSMHIRFPSLRGINRFYLQ